jgi:hypothetical protein
VVQFTSNAALAGIEVIVADSKASPNIVFFIISLFVLKSEPEWHVCVFSCM